MPIVGMDRETSYRTCIDVRLSASGDVLSASGDVLSSTGTEL